MNMVTIGDRLRNELADLESAADELAGAFRMMEEWMPDEAAAVDALWLKVANRRAAIETGHV